MKDWDEKGQNVSGVIQWVVAYFCTYSIGKFQQQLIELFQASQNS